MSNTQIVSSLFLILMGSLDCLTTVIGTLYFGTGELNPLISTLLEFNILAFVIIKLTVTFAVALIFVSADKALLTVADGNAVSLKTAHRLLKSAYYGIVVFLAIVVMNNVFVLIQAMWR